MFFGLGGVGFVSITVLYSFRFCQTKACGYSLFVALSTASLINGNAIKKKIVDQKTIIASHVYKFVPPALRASFQLLGVNDNPQTVQTESRPLENVLIVYV